MSELNIEALKRWDKILATSEVIGDSNQTDEALGSLLEEMPAIFAALQDRERLRAAMKLLLDASDILLNVSHSADDESDEDGLTTDDWLRFGASVNEVRAALENRDG